MNSVIEKCVTDEIAESGTGSKVKTDGAIRENVLLFNMLLCQLINGFLLQDFRNPFGTCKKTDLMYKKEAQVLYDLGVRSIKKYSSRVIKQICKVIDDIPLPYRPHSQLSICDEVDLNKLLVKIEDIKTHLSEIHLEPGGKISFSKNVLYIDDIVHQISSLLFLFKLTRLEGDFLSDFLMRNLDAEFVSYFLDAVDSLNVEYFMKKEGDLNRKFIYSIRASAIAIIKIQLRNHRMEHYELSCIDLWPIYNVDRIVSAVIEI